MRTDPATRHRDDRLVTSGAAIAIVTTLLVTLAVGARHPAIVALLLVGIGGAVWVVRSAVPDKPMLAVTLAIELPLYASIYAVAVEETFPAAHPAVVFGGFAIPIVAFAGGVWHRRRDIARRLAHRRGSAGLGRGFIWLATSAALGVGVDLALPVRSDMLVHSLALLVVTFGIGLITWVLIVDAAALLNETGHLFQTFVSRMARRSVPVFSFLVVFGFIVVIFGTLYAILDHFSHAPNFSNAGTTARLNFADALYFSIVTLSTIGYGDITPTSGIARLIVVAEILFGVVLLLFAFAEIASYEPPTDEDEPTDETPEQGGTAGPPERPG